MRQGYAPTEKDDATGLDHTWFRKNENQAGRWTSPDPYNGSMSLGDPQSFNRYSYVENEPTNYIDPSGLNMMGPGATYFCLPDRWDERTATLYAGQCFVFGGGGGSVGTTINTQGPIDFPGGVGGGIDTTSLQDKCPPVPTHPAGVDINANIEEAKKHGASSLLNPWKGANDYKQMTWFRDQVKNKGPWDYKQVDKVQGKPSPYADFGNFNYGATGLATGLFGEYVLLVEAGAAQIAAGTSKPEWGAQPSAGALPWNTLGIPPYGDDPADHAQIKAGFAYYKAREAGCEN